MNPWQEVVERIEAGDDGDLAEFLAGLSDLGRRAVAVQLPGHLARRLAEDWQARWEVQERATGFRLAGAACLGGAGQVAAWLNRRELRRARDPETDAALILSLIKDRPDEWREDLAARLVERLRPPAGSRTWSASAGLPGWDLAAGLVVETGIEPPDNDAFTAGWAGKLVWRAWMSDGTTEIFGSDPLLDHLLPRLFRVRDAAPALAWSLGWNRSRTVIGELAALAEQGRIQRQALVGGCVERFLAGGDAGGVSPFVALWRELRPETAEIPVLDFTRLLPSAPSPLVQLAVEELRRADRAGALDDGLFTEAVAALAFRPEKKYVTAAITWIAQAPPSRADGALAALATVFDQDTPALRDRAVRLAVKLAPHASESGRDAVREAASRLPAELRDRVAAVAGEVEAARPEPVAAPVAVAGPLPGLPPPITSAQDLADEVDAVRWPDEPAQFERVLAALVELTHRDRDAVAQALQPWWSRNWRQPFDAHLYVYGISGFDRDARSLLSRCALAVASPGDSRELTARLADYNRNHPCYDPAIQLFVQRRLREVIELFEAGRTLPVLLATPTAPTGHVDAVILVERMERLEEAGAAEPLRADFHQALLRLPRQIDPAAAVRAGGLTSRAGRTLAAWLRRGGLPDPAVTCAVETVKRPGAYYHTGEDYYVDVREVHAAVVPPPDLPEPVTELCTRLQQTSYTHDMAWWPAVMPSHREVVAAHLLECLPSRIASRDGGMEVLATLVHGDGPVGAATAAVLALGMGHKHPTQRMAAVDALVTLAARGRLPSADLGRAVVMLLDAGLVKLNRITSALEEAVAAGAHAGLWPAFATALPPLLPGTGERARPGLGDLLAVAVRAAVLTGARADIPRLAEVAARAGSSRVVQEARNLHRQITP